MLFCCWCCSRGRPGAQHTALHAKHGNGQRTVMQRGNFAASGVSAHAASSQKEDKAPSWQMFIRHARLHSVDIYYVGRRATHFWLDFVRSAKFSCRQRKDKKNTDMKYIDIYNPAKGGRKSREKADRQRAPASLLCSFSHRRVFELAARKNT